MKKGLVSVLISFLVMLLGAGTAFAGDFTDDVAQWDDTSDMEAYFDEVSFYDGCSDITKFEMGDSEDDFLYQFEGYSINPDYVDVEDVDLLREELLSAVGEEANDMLNSQSCITVNSEAQAVEAVKQAMLERDDKISLMFTYTNQVFPYALQEMAWAEKVNGAPNEGDYLRGCYHGFGFSVRVYTGYATAVFNFKYMDDIQMEEATDRAVKQWMSEHPEMKGYTDYQKVEAIHDYMAQNIVYVKTEGPFCHTCYSAAVTRKTVCQGYALLFYRLCKEYNVPARYVTGVSSTDGRHAWNWVQVEGKWYNMDVTWDKANEEGLIKYDYFLAGTNEFYNHSLEQIFMSEKCRKNYPLEKIAYFTTKYDTKNTPNPDCMYADLDDPETFPFTTSTPGRAKIIVLVKPYDKASQGVVSSLHDASWIDKIDVLVLPFEDNDTYMNKLRDKYPDNEYFQYGGYMDDVYNSYIAPYYDPYYDPDCCPSLIMIDTKGIIRFATCGRVTAKEIDFRYMPTLVPGWQESISAGKPVQKIELTTGCYKSAQDANDIFRKTTGNLQVTLECGRSLYLKAEAIGEQLFLTDRTLLIELSDSSVIGYDEETGVVKTIKPGTSYITFKSQSNPNVVSQVKINVTAGKGIPFTDVIPGKWYMDAVSYVYQNNIMAGINSNEFRPNDKCTREMVVQILHNLEGKPAAGGAVPFTDVIPGKWYYKSIAWAYEQKVSAGASPTMYGIGKDVTRQEVAMFLFNFANFKGQDTSARNDISRFPDAGAVDGWAMNGISWANAKGIINGKGGGILDPKGKATRAEIAAMIMSYKKAYN